MPKEILIECAHGAGIECSNGEDGSFTTDADGRFWCNEADANIFVNSGSLFKIVKEAEASRGSSMIKKKPFIKYVPPEVLPGEPLASSFFNDEDALNKDALMKMVDEKTKGGKRVYEISNDDENQMMVEALFGKDDEPEIPKPAAPKHGKRKR